MTPWTGWVYIIIQIACVGLSLYYTGKVLASSKFKLQYVGTMVTLQLVTLIVSLLVIKLVMDSIR